MEILITRIYEDHALGKLSEKRYRTLYNNYETEQEQLFSEAEELKSSQAEYREEQKSANRFLDLVKRYENSSTMTNMMLNAPSLIFPFLLFSRKKNKEKNEKKELKKR